MKKLGLMFATASLGILISSIPAYAGVGSDIAMYFFLYAVVIIIIFLICREIVCWYFKINERLSVLLEIRDLLRKSQVSGSQYLNNNSSPDSGVTCAKCGTKYANSAAGAFCENCGTEFSDLKICPRCGQPDVYEATIENGGTGNWCPHCNMSIQQMKAQSGK